MSLYTCETGKIRNQGDSKHGARRRVVAIRCVAGGLPVDAVIRERLLQRVVRLSMFRPSDPVQLMGLHPKETLLWGHTGTRLRALAVEVGGVNR